jgi:hypothetical protein
MKIFLLGTLSAFALSLVASGVFAEEECDPGEPDTLQVSWTAPCEDGSWLLDTEAGCRMWDWHPDPEDTVTWSGVCRAGLREGEGTLQWLEHGRPIDRFEGSYSRNERAGFGRYRWTDLDAYEGHYVAGLPQGAGTVYISGTPSKGVWNRGCLRVDDKVIAIGTSIGACGAPNPGEAVATVPTQR